MTLLDQKRTCSYHIGRTYKTWETFLRHWNRCPSRIKFGYVPKPSRKIRIPKGSDEDLGGHS